MTVWRDSLRQAAIHTLCSFHSLPADQGLPIVTSPEKCRNKGDSGDRHLAGSHYRKQCLGQAPEACLPRPALPVTVQLGTRLRILPTAWQTQQHAHMAQVSTVRSAAGPTGPEATPLCLSCSAGSRWGVSQSTLRTPRRVSRSLGLGYSGGFQSLLCKIKQQLSQIRYFQERSLHPVNRLIW